MMPVEGSTIGVKQPEDNMRPRIPLVIVLAAALAVPVAAQLGSRPAEEWIKTLDGPVRVAGLKIPEVIAAVKLQPGQTVADIGAGSGLFEVPLATAVGPQGKVYAVEVDKAFFPEIRKRVSAAGVTNVETVLGTFTDPALPVKSVDVVFFHDVIHHIEDRRTYLEAVTRYLAPAGRIVFVDYEGGQGPHREQPELEVTREQLTAWMTGLGFAAIEDVKLFPDKYFLVFAKK
jgi:ubiquinone/menaquinone biosynthesis C-methylase UbiE